MPCQRIAGVGDDLGEEEQVESASFEHLLHARVGVRGLNNTIHQSAQMAEDLHLRPDCQVGGQLEKVLLVASVQHGIVETGHDHLVQTVVHFVVVELGRFLVGDERDAMVPPAK